MSAYITAGQEHSFNWKLLIIEQHQFSSHNKKKNTRNAVKLKSSYIRNMTIEHQQISYSIPVSSFLETVFFSLIEEVSLGTAQVDNLGASIAVFLHLCAFLTVISIRYSNTTTDDTPALEWTIVAFITYSYQRTWANIRVTDDALAIVFLAEPSDGNSWLLPAHDQVRMMLGHDPLLTDFQSTCIA